MDEEILSELKATARTRDRSDRLVRIVSSLTKDQLKLFIEREAIAPKGDELVDALFLGLTDDSAGKKKCFKIIELILKRIQSSDVLSCIVNDLVNVVILQLPSLSSEHLKKIIENCSDALCSTDDPHSSWKDILPECFRLLATRTTALDHCDMEIMPKEFLSLTLRTLIQRKWPQTNIPSIAIMFLKISLTKDEHFQVVNKLCCDIESLNSESLPPLLHHLLKLCKDNNSAVIYFRLNDYFNSNLYTSFRSKDTILQESETPTLDFDAIDECPDEYIQRVEATCLYHIGENSNALKKFLVVLKGLLHRPSALLLSPFLVQILLASECHKRECRQIIQSALLNNFQEDLKRTEFVWCKDALPPVVDLDALFDILIVNSKLYCHVISQGLLDLCIALICSGGMIPMYNKIRRFGCKILVKFLKKQPEAAEDALKTLKLCLATNSSNVKSITECLESLFISMPHTMMESTIILQGILEDCFILPDGHEWTDYRRIIESLSNIIKSNPRLRDTLVMICRKESFSKDPRIGCLVVSGFLTLVKILKGKNANLSSQGSSVLSQLSISTHSLSNTATNSRINNATMCLEVVTLLKTCFRQSYEVRELFYKELPNAIKGRSELQDPVLGIIHEHLVFNYYVADIDTLPPLMFDQSIFMKDDSPTMIEPLGRLIFMIQKLLVCENPAPGSNAPGGWSLSGDPEKFYGDAGKLYAILLSLANRISKCTPMHFIKEEGIDVNDIGPESKTKFMILQQAALCCDALIAFRINEWTPNKTDQPQKLLNLIKVHTLIHEFIKNNSSNNKSKKDSGDKKNTSADKENSLSFNSEKSKPKKGKKPAIKFSDMAKNIFADQKSLSPIWDLYTLNRSLDLLYGKHIKWATEEQLNSIRNKRELHFHVLKMGVSMFTSVKGTNLDTQEHLQLTNCAKLLFSNCISKIGEFSDFNQEIAVLAAELFLKFLQIITNNYKDKLEIFLKSIGNIQSYEDFGELISIIMEKISTQIESSIVNVSLTEDPIARKLPSVMFEIITILLQHLPDTSICEKWTEWLQKFGSKTNEEIKNLSAPLISCLMSLISKSSESWNVYELLIKKLGQILNDEDETEDKNNEDLLGEFAILTTNASGAYIALCSHINSRLTTIDNVIARIKADQLFMQYRKAVQLTTAKASLKNREKCICSELCCAATAIQQLSVISCPAGPCCDAILRLVSKLHATLAALTLHFTTREPQAIQTSRFDKLVKICGKAMTKAIDTLITHVESVPCETKRSTNAKAQAKIVKDSKHIPRLVYNCELFYKRVNQLSSKTKVDLDSYLSQGSARDFRIRASDVKEALKNNNCADEEADESMEVDNDDDEQMDVESDKE